jgi:hypothetical protein
MIMGATMENFDWGKLWEGITKFLPAFGGSFISLKYLPKDQRTFIGVASALIGGIVLGVYGGAWVVGFYEMDATSWNANGVMLVISTIGFLILDKFVAAFREIKIRDVRDWLKDCIRKWVA